jgi:polysaccharide biosynthesis protein PelF
VLGERVAVAGTPPALDLVAAATLYQTLYWVARTAAEPTPDVDVLLATAAGWSAIPALVHKALHGTPLVLTEHGVYVREAYLAAARSGDEAGARFIATRLARGLTRMAYAGADVVCPVTDANTHWELGLGVDPAKLLVLYNGLPQPRALMPPPQTQTVVSVGRIDPLKDLHTLLRVAAETIRAVPDARFAHYGTVTEGEEAYGRSCLALHERLGLGERFRFMGRTTDPHGAVREADVVLMTSISEGLPMSVLEAMAEGRPVVCTSVGGVPDVVKGCGVVAAPGDDHGLAMAVVTLLRNPGLAWRLGQRGHARLGRIFNEQACVEGYRGLLGDLCDAAPRLRVVP